MGNVVKLENEKQNKEKNQAEIENVYEGFVFQFLRAVSSSSSCMSALLLFL